jgi:RNA polymerase sigma-70 factor, ECF subfamily
LPEEAFGEALRKSAEKRFGGLSCSPGDLEDYLKSLQLEDLALACACALGMESAWEYFIANFRRDLRAAAGAMLRASGSADDARAAELADSLYAELYGIRVEDGRRKSLFEYFHGRSKLSTWLRAVLAQKQVDLIRASGKTVPLEEGEERELPGGMATVADRGPADPSREKYLARIDLALSAALAGLASRERMILACYYVDQLTLAEIGRILHEHESTVSRQLERLRRGLRETVTQALRHATPAIDGRAAEPALDAAQIELAFEYASEDWAFDLARELSAAPLKPEGPSGK